MNEFTIKEIRQSDQRGMAKVDALLASQALKRDPYLEYTIGLFDREHHLVATGSAAANTLRCLAVDARYQGEGLLNTVMSALSTFSFERGITHLFLYTKVESARFFEDIGYHQIAKVGETLVFMENRRDGFATFLDKLATEKREGVSAALVMNCNPFTLGHRYLVEKAAGENDTVHLFIVSEDASLFPFADRFEMVKNGCADLTNVILHQTGSYMISSAVFPSYFLESSEAAIRAQARLDIALFARIARALNVTKRYVGEEPFSKVTNIYNEVMFRDLPPEGVRCIVIPRRETAGRPIIASHVRQLIHDGKLDEAKALIPPTTFAYFMTEAGQRTMARIRESDSVIHY